MSVANKIDEIFKGHLGDAEDLKRKVGEYIHDKVVTVESEAVNVADLPDDPVPYGIYKIATGGTVNGGALTLATDDLALWDEDEQEYVKLGITRAD